ncbi:MAG: PLP-dependent aminotransferase family protein [Spirochaetaceae bacterium]
MNSTDFFIDKTNGPLYIQLYENIRSKILKKDLLDGEKLPTIRSLAMELKVNNITIINAYKKLEENNLVEKKVGSGCFVKKRSLSFSTNIMDLTGTDSNIDNFPLQDLKDSINYVLNNDGLDVFKYEDSRGNFELKLCLTEYFKKYNIDTTPELIQIVSGGQQALDIISKSLIVYGETVFTETPTYKGAIDSFKSREARIIDINLDEDGININELEAKLQIRKPSLIYIMPFNQKPTGITYSLKKKKKLIELAHRYNFYIIEDDMGSEIEFNREDSSTLKSLDIYDRVIYIKSFTPLFMPGLRLGCLVAPKTIYNKLLNSKLSTDISTSGLLQRAFTHYLTNFDWQDYYNNLSNELMKKIDFVTNILNHEFLDLLDFNNNSISTSFWFKLKLGDGEKLAEICNTNNLRIIPGAYMGVDYTNYFRINLNSIPYKNIKKAMNVLKKSITDLYLIKRESKNDFY